MEVSDKRDELIEYVMLALNKKLELTTEQYNRIWESFDCFLDIARESDYAKIKASFDRRILRL